MSETHIGHEQFYRMVSNGISRYEQSGKLFMTGFLTPAQIIQASPWLRWTPHRFVGGRENAMRCRLIVGQEEPPDSQYVTLLKAQLSPGQKRLSHSDVLGALMHSGLERDAIGDIAVDENAVCIVCLPSVADYIRQNLVKIAHTNVRFENCDAKDFPPAVFEHLKINTASMRADCIVSALAHMSRSNAKEMIRQGFVKVNDEVLESVKPLCNNDTISVRRSGKYQILDLDGVSRKGRLIVNIIRYQ